MAGTLSGPRRRRLIAACLIVIATGVVIVIHGHRSAPGYRVEMRPVEPLSVAACRAEERRLRMVAPSGYCSPPARRPWFRITVGNVHDANGYPVCSTTAFDRTGRALFTRDVPMGLVGGEPSGPAVRRGTTLRLTWYFDAPTHDPSYTQEAPWTSADIRSYSATCHGRPEWQVPI